MDLVTINGSEDNTGFKFRKLKSRASHVQLQLDENPHGEPSRPPRKVSKFSLFFFRSVNSEFEVSLAAYLQNAVESVKMLTRASAEVHFVYFYRFGCIL